MSAIDREAVLAALRRIRPPDAEQDIVTAGLVTGLVVKDSNVGFAIEVAPEEGEAFEPVRKAAEAAVRELAGVTSVTAVLTAERAGPPEGAAPSRPTSPSQEAAAQAPRQRPLAEGVGAIVAVASGKGGVGKSTTAVNLAMGLARLGLRTGLLDADIYGPSLPRMAGLSGRPPAAPDGQKLAPLVAHDVKVMSMGFLVDEDAPMIWRGPMVQSAIQQMLGDVAWGELDVMVVDLPPGTGDAQLTMAQRVPLAGAVIVSTPQDIALLDVKKAVNMFRKVDVPILGIVENMSYFCCPNCGHRTDIFAYGGARTTAAAMEVDFLAEVPLDPVIRELSDSGRPVVVADPDTAQAQAYMELARNVVDRLEGAERKPAPRIVYA
ncbi:MAG: P-loop NTPase [Alphaproteobacteria bacterium]|jgi:ATP-binding protein involved in chromosome partitioning|nr:P-loop NTPase [Alphaproteobacteria bacterium]